MKLPLYYYPFSRFMISNLINRGERDGLGRREKRPKKIGRREKGSKKIGRRENQLRKGGPRMFFKKM